eukprot:10836275-Karenia_brevis.AAC.1
MKVSLEQGRWPSERPTTSEHPVQIDHPFPTIAVCCVPQPANHLQQCFRNTARFRPPIEAS